MKFVEKGENPEIIQFETYNELLSNPCFDLVREREDFVDFIVYKIRNDYCLFARLFFYDRLHEEYLGKISECGDEILIHFDLRSYLYKNFKNIDDYIEAAKNAYREGAQINYNSQHLVQSGIRMAFNEMCSKFEKLTESIDHNFKFLERSIKALSKSIKDSKQS